MLRVLIVEDKSERIDIFRQIYFQHQLTSSVSAEVAIQLLEQDEYDLLHLDYDLEGELTGDAVAHYVSERQQTALIAIHSANPEGVAKITELLPEAVAVPFVQFSEKSDLLSRIRAILSRVDFDRKEMLAELREVFCSGV